MTTLWKQIALAVAAIVVVIAVFFVMTRPAKTEAPPAPVKEDVSPPPETVKTSDLIPEPEPRSLTETPLAPPAPEGQAQPEPEPAQAPSADVTRPGAWSLPDTGERVLAPLTSADIPEDNGAHFFLLATELYPDVDVAWLKLKWAELRSGESADDPAFREALASFQAAIDAIKKGLDTGNIQMPDPRRFSEPMPYVEKFRQLVQVMGLEAEVYAADGDDGDAFNTCLTAMNFAVQASKNTTSLFGRLGYSMTDTAAEALRQVLIEGGATPQEYKALVAQLRSVDQETTPAATFIRDEASLHDKWYRAEVAAGTDFRAQLLAQMGYSEDQFDTVSDETMDKMFSDAAKDYQLAVESFSQPYYKWRAEYKGVPAASNPISKLLLPVVADMRTEEARTHAEVRGDMLLAAIEQYASEKNSYPATLDDLLPHYLSGLPEDPFTGQVFQYKPTDTGFLLYSAGPDMQDNNGGAGDWRQEGSDLVINNDAGK